MSTCRDRTIVVPITGRGNSRRAGAEELAPEGGPEGRSPQPRKQRMPSRATSTDPTHRCHRLRIAIRDRFVDSHWSRLPHRLAISGVRAGSAPWWERNSRRLCELIALDRDIARCGFAPSALDHE